MTETYDPNMILTQMRSAYARLRSYSDRGYAETINSPGTEAETHSKISFTTNLLRPSHYRFEWKEVGETEWSAAIWTDGKTVFNTSPCTGVREVSSLVEGIRDFATCSPRVANKVPLWLFPEIEYSGLAIELLNFGFCGVEMLFGEQCYHLRKAESNCEGPCETELWISKTRSLVLKIREKETVDFVTFDAWYQGRLSDTDSDYNERLVSVDRERWQQVNELLAQDRGSIKNWKLKELDSIYAPHTIITDTYYEQVSSNHE